MNPPSWRSLYDTIERELEPRLERLVRTPVYARTTALAAGVRSRIGSSIGSVNARVLHTVNLPAGTDVKRLRRQIGELDREVRLLRLEIAESARESRDDRD